MSARAELGTLEASGLIQIAALEPELEYLFRHALVQEAAYASLLKQDRRALHLAAAETILELHADRERELAGVIGMHLEQAGDGARAARFLIVAGDHALERFANREAMGFFARAGELAGDDVALRLRAAVGGARAGWTYSEPGSDIAKLESALGTGEGAEEVLAAEAYFWVAFLRRQRGEVPESSPELRHAMQRATEVGARLHDPAVAAFPRALMGSYVAFMGGLREGARQMQEALDGIEPTGDRVSVAMVSDFLAMTYARLGEFEAAERVIAHARGLAVASDAIARVDVDIAEAALHLERGEADQASAQALDCAVRAEGLGAYACVVVSNMMYGAASLAREDAPAAKAPLERGSELCRVTNMAPVQTLTQALLGSTRARLGDIPGGVAGWEAALGAARSMDDRYGEAQTLWGRARTYARQSPQDWERAFADVDRAVELFEAMEARPSLARALLDRAQANRRLGRELEAAEDETRGLALGRELALRDAPFA